MLNFRQRKRRDYAFGVTKSIIQIINVNRKIRESLEMFVVKTGDEEFEIIENEEMGRKELNVVEVIEDKGACVELPINYVVGLNDSGTMKVKENYRTMKWC